MGTIKQEEIAGYRADPGNENEELIKEKGEENMSEIEQFNKLLERDKEWENSLEGIHYDLGGVYGVITAQDQIDEVLICVVLQKVPEEVRVAVLESVTFILTANLEATLFGMRFHPPEGRDYDERHFIILNLRGSKKRKMTTIAHEIAHFILGHSGMEHHGGTEDEKAADDLIEQWGFRRAYDSYDQFLIGRESMK